MKVVSTIFLDNKRKREARLLALTVVLILVLCTLIAATASASTEADPPVEREIIELNDGTKVVIEKPSGALLAVVETETAKKTLHCKLVATAVFNDMTKTTYKSFELQEADATVLSAKLSEIAQRVQAGGATRGEITCKSINNANTVHVYELKF